MTEIRGLELKRYTILVEITAVTQKAKNTSLQAFLSVLTVVEVSISELTVKAIYVAGTVNMEKQYVLPMASKSRY